MIEIGANLKYEKRIFQELDGSVLKLEDAAGQIHQCDLSEIDAIEIVGIKSNSGYCGTMEWGMKNPTFILPTNFFYNIINAFKRKRDPVHLKVTKKDGDEFIVIGNKNLYIRLKRELNNR